MRKTLPVDFEDTQDVFCSPWDNVTFMPALAYFVIGQVWHNRVSLR